MGWERPRVGPARNGASPAATPQPARFVVSSGIPGRRRPFALSLRNMHKELRTPLHRPQLGTMLRRLRHRRSALPTGAQQRVTFKEIARAKQQSLGSHGGEIGAKVEVKIKG